VPCLSENLLIFFLAFASGIISLAPAHQSSLPLRGGEPHSPYSLSSAYRPPGSGFRVKSGREREREKERESARARVERERESARERERERVSHTHTHTHTHTAAGPF